MLTGRPMLWIDYYHITHIITYYYYSYCVIDKKRYYAKHLTGFGDDDDEPA